MERAEERATSVLDIPDGVVAGCAGVGEVLVSGLFCC